MCRNHFIIGIMPNKEIWLRAKELRNIEVIPLNKEGVAFCNTASLDIEVLSVSICAMRFGLPVSEGSASIHPVHDSRLAPLVIVPPTDIVEETLPKVKDGDSESTIYKTDIQLP